MRNRKTTFLNNRKRRISTLRRSFIRRRRTRLLEYISVKFAESPAENNFLVRGGKLLQNRYYRRRHLLSRNLHE